MKRGSGIRVNLVLLAASTLISLTVALVAVELYVRGKNDLGLHWDERNLAYRYDDELGWFPIANQEREFLGRRKIRVQHNERGFRDRPHRKTERPVLLVLGDSFVWGYDVEEAERFTSVLQARFPEIDIFNLGVSGYGTDQELLLLQRELPYYDPEAVLLVFTNTDRGDNRSTSDTWATSSPTSCLLQRASR